MVTELLGNKSYVGAQMCFLVCFIPVLDDLLKNDPKPKAPEAVANWAMAYVSLRFTHSNTPPHNIINSDGTVR